MEFLDEYTNVDAAPMTIEDVEIPGVYNVSESGSGFTERYRTQAEAGGDTVDEPPAASLTVQAYCTEAQWEQLNALRESRDPFPVSIGPYAFDEMGITNLERVREANQPAALALTVTLQEFREVIVQSSAGSGGSGDGPNYGQDPGGGGGSDPSYDDPGGVGTPGGPVAQWTDTDGDKQGDDSGEALEYNRETIPSGVRESFGVAGGETFSGQLLDATANNANFVVAATGQDWTIRDVGIAGPSGTTGGDSHFGLHEQGGSSLVENVYMGDGAPSYTGDTGQTGMWYNNDSTGHVDIRLVNIQMFPDNGIYASAPANSATVTIQDCFGRNNGHANFRLANGEVINCVSVIDSDFSHTGNRAVWGRVPGPVSIQQSEVASASGSAIHMGAHDGPTVVNVEDGTTVQGSIGDASATRDVAASEINWSGGASEGTADLGAYHGRIPGSPADAATGVRTDSATDGGS